MMPVVSIKLHKYNIGDIAYLVESNYIIREGKIMSNNGGMLLFKFTEGGAVRIKEHRLFKSEEAAQAEIDRIRAERKQNRISFLF